jgi:hypothetical protein
MSGVHQQHEIGAEPPERAREILGGRAGIEDEAIGSRAEARGELARDLHTDRVVTGQVVADPQYRDAR